MVTEHQVAEGEVTPEPSQEEPSRTYTSEELTQALQEAQQRALEAGKVQGRAEVQRGKEKEFKELRQRLTGVEAENAALQELAQSLDLVRDRDPELYEVITEKKRAAELTQREKHVASREQGVELTAQAEERARNMMDWGTFIGGLLQEAKVELSELDIAEDLAERFGAGQENPLSWHTPKGFENMVRGSIKRARGSGEVAALKKQLANTQKDLGKVKEETEFGTPALVEGSSERKLTYAEAAGAFARGELTHLQFAAIRKREGLS